jgi:hypothetical protein
MMRSLLEYVQVLLGPLHSAINECWHGGVYCHSAFIMAAFNFMAVCIDTVRSEPVRMLKP